MIIVIGIAAIIALAAIGMELNLRDGEKPPPTHPWLEKVPDNDL